ncbi:MAG: DUF692 family protein [Polyangiaceae bacterium]|nr:DUF692 family protein [Polyangiaceae bacterium]MCB9608770.1 DUF692 family protein [Polyangiaceae bacterium]
MAQSRTPQHGVGLRTKHYPEVLQSGMPLGLIEAITENFIDRGGRPRKVIERVRQDSPIAFHGVSLSVGGAAPLDREFLQRLRTLASELEASWVSDHLCFGRVGKHYGHDLWPLPFTEESLSHVAARIREAQDILGQQILLENVSSYVEYAESTLTEWEFLAALVRESGCALLLDVNNVFVSAFNHGFSAEEYIQGIPQGCVRQLHLAGHLDKGDFLLDNHGSQVPDGVWQLYRQVVRRFGAVPCIIEWDENVPELPRLLEESATAARIEAEELPHFIASAVEASVSPSEFGGEVQRIAPTLAASDSKTATLQQLFWRSVRYDPAPPEVDQEFLDRGAMSGRDRMAVYRNMYWFRQVDALFDSFPRLARALGTEHFTKLITRYISAYPSEHFALEYLGRCLPQKILEEISASSEPRTENGRSILKAAHADLASLEWAHLFAFLAADHEALDTSAIDPTRFGDSRLAWAPCLQVVEVTQLALDAWDQLKEDGSKLPSESALAFDSEVVPSEREQCIRKVAIWRKNLFSHHVTLEADEARALESARAGASLAAVCDGFQDAEDPVGRAFGVLRGWFSRGWIVALEEISAEHAAPSVEKVLAG